jgi:hypothetical protein
MSLLLTLSDKKKTRRSIFAVTPRAAALLAVATDVRMYAINNDEVKQTANNYYLILTCKATPLQLI